MSIGLGRPIKRDRLSSDRVWASADRGVQRRYRRHPGGYRVSYGVCGRDHGSGEPVSYPDPAVARRLCGRRDGPRRHDCSWVSVLGKAEA